MRPQKKHYDWDCPACPSLRSRANAVTTHAPPSPYENDDPASTDRMIIPFRFQRITRRHGRGSPASAGQAMPTVSQRKRIGITSPKVIIIYRQTTANSYINFFLTSINPPFFHGYKISMRNDHIYRCSEYSWDKYIQS